MKFWTEGTRFVLGVGAICVTLGVGTCSTNARIGDVNARIDAVQVDIRDLRALLIESLKRLEKLAYRTPSEAREEYELRHAA